MWIHWVLIPFSISITISLEYAFIAQRWLLSEKNIPIYPLIEGAKEQSEKEGCICKD